MKTQGIREYTSANSWMNHEIFFSKELYSVLNPSAYESKILENREPQIRNFKRLDTPFVSILFVEF
jgi:hypothetical protein